MNTLKPSRATNSRGYYSSSSEDEDSSVNVRKKINPVSNLSVTAYMGKWYQVYTSLSPLLTFELGGRNTTAVYTETNVPGVIEVHNRNEPSYLPPQEIKGWARASPSTQGIFYVSLGAAAASRPENAVYKKPGNYWIIALGPIVQGSYQWSVVTNSNRSQLYILCRNPDSFKKLYDKEVLEQVKIMGFTSTWNRPRETEQSHV